jgi:hypothetical protein
MRPKSFLVKRRSQPIDGRPNQPRIRKIAVSGAGSRAGCKHLSCSHGGSLKPSIPSQILTEASTHLEDPRYWGLVRHADDAWPAGARYTCSWPVDAPLSSDFAAICLRRSDEVRRNTTGGKTKTKAPAQVWKLLFSYAHTAA